MNRDSLQNCNTQAAMTGNGGELTRKRDTVYDWIRVIAIILVVLAHSTYMENFTKCGGVYYPLPENTSPVYYSGFFTFLRACGGWVASFVIELFFMMSGAVLAIKPPESLLDFAKKKFMRLIVPFYACGLLYVIPVKFFAGYYNKSNVLYAAFYYVILIEKTHLWFLPVLFCSMILFAVIYKLLYRKEKSFDWAFLILPALLLHLIDRNGIVHIRFLSVIVSYFLWFVIGFAFELRRRNSAQWNLVQTVIGMILLIAFEVVRAVFQLDPGYYLTAILRSMLVFLVAKFCSIEFIAVTETKFWKIITRNFLNIYLFHDPLEYLILKIFMSGGLLSKAVNCYLFYLLRFAGTILLSVGIGEALRSLKKSLRKKTKTG